jgi:tetratricopeptide (TPR) repeat protein
MGVDAPPTVPRPESDAFRRVMRLAYGITAVLVLLFIPGVLAYAKFGGDAVEGLSERNGEILLTRARTAAKAGAEDEAVPLYAKAIQGSFSSRDLKIWAMEEYVRYLLDLDRPTEAIPIMVRAVELGPRRASAYDLLVQVFLQAQDYQQALRAADLWIERLEESQDAPGLDRAQRVRRQILEKTSPQEQAQ